MIEKGVAKLTAIVDKGEWRKWHVFWVAFGLMFLVFFTGFLNHLLLEALGAVVIFGFMYPLKNLKDSKVYGFVRNFPIEAVGFGFLFSLWFYAVQGSSSLRWARQTGGGANFRAVTLWSFVGFVIFYALAYFILYLRDLWVSKVPFKGHSLLAKWYVMMFKFDLKKDVKRSLILGTMGHMAVIGILGFIVLLFLFEWHGAEFFAILIILAYPFGFYFHRRYKVSKIQSQYRQLFDITKELSKGNLDISMEQDLGMFNSLRDELAQIKDGFKAAVQNAIASERMKTDLITNVSHDLKTPLTAIITYVDLLQDDSLTEETRHQYLGVLEQKSHRLKDLIEDLFEMSRVTSGIVKLDREPLNVVSLMKQTLTELSHQIEGAGLMIRSNFPEHPVIMNLDGMRTHRVFENLIVNMAKYALPNTRAYIDIEDSASDVSITLRNISATELSMNPDELTERFVRADGARSTEGSGLGLAIAKSLVVIQEGAFDVQIDGDLFKVNIVFKK